jgi:hypothetical protein
MANRATCLRALAEHEDELSQLPHVVGLGVVPLDDDKPRGDLAVGVYVANRVPDDVIPSKLEVKDRNGHGIEVPVRVIEQGPVELESAGG